MINLGGIYGDDIYKIFRAEQIALRSTELGRGGVVKVELDEQNQRIQYRMLMTGNVHEDVEEAFLEASRLRVTQFDRILPSSGRVGETLTNPRRAQMSAILQSMQDLYDQRIADSPEFASFVSRITGETDLSGLRLSGSMASTGATSGKEAQEFFRAAKATLGGYVPIVSDEGVDVLQVQIGKTKLSSAQMNMLMAYLESGIINPSKYRKIFGEDITESEKAISKLSKRLRAFTSERDVAFQIQDVVDAMRKTGKRGAQTSLESLTVVVEEGSDVLRQHLFGGQSFTDELFYRGKIMRGVDTKGIIDASIRRTIMQERNLTPEQLLDFINTDEYTAKSQRLTSFLESKRFKKLVKNSRDNKSLLDAFEKLYDEKKIGEDQYKFFKEIMDVSEKAFDGYSVLNKKVYDRGKSQLKRAIESLESEIKSGNFSEQVLTNKKEQLSMLQEQYNKIKNAKNLYQVTARGQMGAEELKAAFDIVDLGGDFENIAMVVTRAALKNDIQLGNKTNQIILSGLGSPKDIVYADPVSLAFHPEIFASEEDVANYTRYAQEINNELRGAIESNTLPEKVLKAFEEIADEDYSNLEPARRLSKEKYKELARQTIALHQSGIGPKESALMMNMLHSHYTTQMFKVTIKDGHEILMPALQNVNRLAIVTEATEAMRGNLNVNQAVGIGEDLAPPRSVLSKYVGSKTGRTGFQSVAFKNAEGTQEIAELAKFRVSKGKLIFAAEAVAENFYGLGGFDLDDKGLPKLFRGNVGDELFFSITRQPSGVQEIIFASAKLNDIDTLKGLFGKDEFKKSLDDLINNAPLGYDVGAAKTLKNILSGEAKAVPNLDEQEMMSVISDVYRIRETEGLYGITTVSDQVAGQIIKYGSAPLYNTNVFSEGNLLTLEAVDYSKLDDATKAARQNERVFIYEKMKQILPEYRNDLDPTLFQELSRAESMQDINNIVLARGQNVSAPLRALIDQSVLGIMEESVLQTKDILGVYVNRSMVIGSTLDQTKAFMEAATEEEAKFLSRYKIAFAGQEFAIDRAVNYAEQQRFIARALNAVEILSLQRDDPMAAMGYLESLIQGTDTTLDEMMQNAMEMLGKRIGAQSAIFMGRQAAGQQALDKNLFPILQTLLAQTRMTTEADYEKIIGGMIAGIQDVRTNLGYQGAEIDNLLSRLEKAKLSSELAKELIEDFFTAEKDHKFGQINNLMRAAEEQRALAETTRRLGIAGMPVDQALAAVDITDEARRAADFILDTNKKEMDRVFDQKLKDLSDIERMRLFHSQQAMHNTVMSQIRTAAEAAGTSQEEIINAMEKRAAQRDISFMNYEKLYGAFGEDEMTFQKSLQTVRSRRIRDFYRKTIDAGEMEKIEKVAKIISSGFSYEDLAERSIWRSCCRDRVCFR